MEIAVKYRALKNEEYAKIDYMAFLCEDGQPRHLSIEEKQYLKLPDGSILMTARCNRFPAWTLETKPYKILPTDILLYWGCTGEEKKAPGIWIEAIDLYANKWRVRVEGSVRLQYSYWCRDVCSEKHYVLDEESCMRLAFSKYLENSYMHMPEAADDDIKERVAQFWYKIAQEKDDEE